MDRDCRWNRRYDFGIRIIDCGLKNWSDGVFESWRNRFGQPRHSERSPDLFHRDVVEELVEDFP